jgi:hypothetical protein
VKPRKWQVFVLLISSFFIYFNNYAFLRLKLVSMSYAILYSLINKNLQIMWIVTNESNVISTCNSVDSYCSNTTSYEKLLIIYIMTQELSISGSNKYQTHLIANRG